jgi:hypothetical protein
MKKLNLNRETVRNLTSSDLDVVAGGKPGEPCNETIPTEWPTCETCETCVTCDTNCGCPPATSPRICQICDETD